MKRSILVAAVIGMMLNTSSVFAGNIIVDESNQSSLPGNTLTAVSSSGIFGTGNIIDNSAISAANDDAVIGTGNTITNIYNSGVYGSFNANMTNVNSSLIVGNSNVAISNIKAVTVLGGLNTVTDSSLSSLTGANCTLTDSTYSTIDGFGSAVEHTSEAGIIGKDDTISGGSQNAIIGSGNTLTGSSQNFVAGFNDKLGANLTDDQILGSNATVAAGVANSVIMGTSTNVSASNAVAIGHAAAVSAADSVALGSNATAGTVNSVALGSGSVTGTAHTDSAAQSITLKGTTYTFAGQASASAGTVSVGSAGNERQIQNVAAGDVSATSTDAVNGSQLYAVAQSVGGDISNINNEINRLGGKVKDVGAAAAALSALHPLDFDPEDKWDFATGYGHYQSANAVSIGAFYRPNEDVMVSFGASLGNSDERMYNAGLTFKLGMGNHISTSRTTMAEQIVSLENKNSALNSKVENLQKSNETMQKEIDLLKQKIGV